MVSTDHTRLLVDITFSWFTGSHLVVLVRIYISVLLAIFELCCHVSFIIISLPEIRKKL